MNLQLHAQKSRNALFTAGKINFFSPKIVGMMSKNHKKIVVIRKSYKEKKSNIRKPLGVTLEQDNKTPKQTLLWQHHHTATAQMAVYDYKRGSRNSINKPYIYCIKIQLSSQLINPNTVFLLDLNVFFLSCLQTDQIRTCKTDKGTMNVNLF